MWNDCLHAMFSLLCSWLKKGRGWEKDGGAMQFHLSRRFFLMHHLLNGVLTLCTDTYCQNVASINPCSLEKQWVTRGFDRFAFLEIQNHKIAVLWPLNHAFIQHGVRLGHLGTDSTRNRRHSPPLPLYLFERCAQAIKNKETWTGYLSLGFLFCFVFHCCSSCHVCFICFMSAMFLCFFYLCMYISLYRSYIVPLVNTHFAISYLKIKHNEHMYPVLHVASFTVISLKPKWKRSISPLIWVDKSLVLEDMRWEPSQSIMFQSLKVIWWH